MKRILPLFLCLTGLITLIVACKPADKAPSNRMVVTGKILNFSDSSTVFTYDAFELLAATQKPVVNFGPDGSFKLVIESASPVKGFFSFGRVPFTYNFTITQVNGQDSTLSVESADFRMVYLWLEPGDSLTMNTDVENISETLEFSGTGAINNEFINSEEEEFGSYKHKYLENYYHLTYRQPNDYKKVTDQLREEKMRYLTEYASRHRLSDALVRVYQTEYMTGAITSKIHYPSGHAGFNDGKEAVLPAGYYSFVDSVRVEKHIGDKGIGYYYFLNSWLRKKFELSGGKESVPDEFYAFVRSQLPGELAYEFMAYALARDFRKNLYDVFGESCPYPEIAQRVKQKYQDREGMLEGNPAPDFTLPDVAGKDVSLKDLRGNFVYIDFWATWCVPCIREIPDLKRIADEYRGKNIRFVSISLDKPADHEKWRRFVVENELTGIQLIANDSMHSVYKKTFNIDLIPRFILLDPEGKIVSGNAPRPSNARLPELLDKSGVR